MERLKIIEFNKGLVNLDWEITCSVEEVIKLGLLGYLDSISELRLRQYLILRETKVLGGLTDYKLENYWLNYCGQAQEVELQLPVGVVDSAFCFANSVIEKLSLHGENIGSLFSLVDLCSNLRDILIDVNFSDEVINLGWCFSRTNNLEQIIFSQVVKRAKVSRMFLKSDIKHICLRSYVLTVEDVAFECFCGCKKLVDLDCSEVKFNNGVVSIVGENPKLETISFRDCWFEDRVELVNGRFLRPVTIDLRGARCKGIEKVKSLSTERKSNKAVGAFIKQFELENVTLILD